MMMNNRPNPEAEERILQSFIDSSLQNTVATFLENVDVNDRRHYQQVFAENCKRIFRSQMYSDASKAVSEAELELFIFIQTKLPAGSYVEILKLIVKDDSQWALYPNSWLQTLQPVLNKKDLVLEIKKYLIEKIDKEVTYWNKSEKNNENLELLLSLLRGAIFSIDETEDLGEIKLILEDINRQKQQLLSISTYLKNLGIFSSQSAADKEANTHKILKLNKKTNP